MITRCPECYVIMSYRTGDGRTITLPKVRHTCRPVAPIRWEIERDPDGTPRRMWWVGRAAQKS